MNGLLDSVEQKGQTATEKIYEFLEKIQPNHAIWFFLLAGVLTGYLFNGYMIITSDDMPLLMSNIAWIGYGALTTGLLIMVKNEKNLSVFFLIKIVLIFFVGFVVEYQLMALSGKAEEMKPLFGNTVNGQEFVMGWVVFVLFVLMSTAFCLAAPNEE